VQRTQHTNLSSVPNATHQNRLKVALIWVTNGFANPVGTGKSPDQTLNKTAKVEERMGKGSVPRPFSVSNEEYSNRWDLIFGKDNEQKENKEKTLESDRPDSAQHSGSSNNTSSNSGQTQIS
jgi:hypothetical protein